MDTIATATDHDTSSTPAYDPALDPFTVGAAFSKKLGDTLNIKMFEVLLKPGDSLALHTHPDHTIYVLQGGKMEVTVPGKGKGIMEVKPGDGWVAGQISDFAKNIGKTTVKWVEVDVYRPLEK